jgi:RNA 3'-terminal phosphate cyclase (ATP)
MIEIDGSRGEGGGQILRTSLALACVTRTPVRIVRVRAGRERPGLQRQHLAAVRAATAVSNARLEGAAIGSTVLVFEPRDLVPGDYRFEIGSAGSATLVLETVLPALLRAGGPSTVVVEGGTHNPLAPPFPFLERAFLPLLRRMGARLELALERPGFYPRGGGRVRARIEPASLGRLELMERGAVRARRVEASVAALPVSIAEREVATALRTLDWEKTCGEVRVLDDAFGPGNVVTVEVEAEHVTEVFTGFGEKGVRAENVARAAAGEARAWLEAQVPVGPHLADQLLLPLALGGGGRFRTMPPTLHTTTHAEVLALFLPVSVETREISRNVWEISVEPK